MMQLPGRSVSLPTTLHTRRRALQAVAAAAGSVLLIASATRTGLRPSALAQDGDDHDNSGHGSSNSGRGHGGDGGEEEDEAVLQAQIPPGSTEIRIVSDDAGGFVPGELTVDLGQSVTFVNTHSDEHTATGSGFDTGIIPEGGTATVVMEEPGIFPYACQIHPVMTGQIAVRDESGVVPQPQTTSASPTADAAQVRIANLAFDPATTTVATGNTVTWSNDDTVPHTVTADDGLFDSGILDPGGSFSWTFTDPGSIAYHCQLHPTMQATVVVEGAPVAGTTSAAADGATPEPGATAAGAVSDASASVQPGVWVVDFAPDDASVIAPQHALLSLHTDGLVRADFAAAGASAATDRRLTAGQGSWQMNGDRLDLALIAFVVDDVGQLRGTLTIQAESQGGPESGALSGNWTFSLTDPSGATVADGQGFWQGTLAPLDIAASPG
jgi:plastocyanin